MLEITDKLAVPLDAIQSIRKYEGKPAHDGTVYKSVVTLNAYHPLQYDPYGNIVDGGHFMQHFSTTPYEILIAHYNTGVLRLKNG